MRLPAAALTILLLATLLPGAGAAQEGGATVVVLLHHPFDKVDPFGVPYGDGDSFSARHLAISQAGRFDFPTFLADGVLPIVSLPDPTRPFAATLANYTAAVQDRLKGGSPGTMDLQGSVGGDALTVTVGFQPHDALADPQHPDGLHLFVAVVEDFIHYQPDARVSNGVTDHRFTVRALADTGPADLSGPLVNRTHQFALDPAWNRDHLLVASWIEAGAAFGRFHPGEVLQAAWTPVGVPVHQTGKAVLVELYSATWCAPCLYGDLAAERLAVDFGGAAEAAKPAGPHYFRAPTQPAVALIAALAAGAAMLAWTNRNRDGRTP